MLCGDISMKSFVKEYLEKSRKQQKEVEKLNREDILYLEIYLIDYLEIHCY